MNNNDAEMMIFDIVIIWVPFVACVSSLSMSCVCSWCHMCHYGSFRFIDYSRFIFLEVLACICLVGFIVLSLDTYVKVLTIA